MNIYVLFSLLLFLAPPGGCPIYSIDLSTLEVPNNDFQNELTLRSMLNSELQQYRNELNKHSKIIDRSQDTNIQYDDGSDVDKSIEEDIKATYNGGAETDQSAATLGQSQAEESFDDSLKVHRSANAYGEFLGTNLFANFPKRCFSIEDIALLSARRDFEALLPKSYPQRLLNDSIVYMLMKYFNRINQIIKRMSDDDTRRVLQRAFYDSLGGYLRYYILPIAHVSYYAGRLKLCTVERLLTVYRTCKFVLNTNGNGWKAPLADILSELSNVHIDAIKLEEGFDSESDAASCALLDQSCDTKDAENEKMIVPLPSLEPEDRDGFLNNIFLPFKSRRIYNLQSPNSASILVKFFKAVTNCYRFQGICPKIYNLRMRAWIRECVQVHYKDELFYPGLGGVLQIYKYLNSVKNSQTNEQTIVNEQDAKDYPISLEEIEDEGAQCSKKNKNMEKTKTNIKKNNTAVKDNGKQPRSSNQYNMATQVDNGKIRTDENGEQCVECEEDSSYIAYIVGFLSILLLVLLGLICCCMRRRGNKERKPRRKQKGTRKSLDGQPVVLPESVRRESGTSNKEFTTVNESSKANKPETEVQKREAAPTGLGMMNYHDESYALFDGRHGPEEDIEQGTYTSTSSLACQLPRKLIPLPFRRDKQRDYYALKEMPEKSEKVRRKSKRPPSVLEKQKLNAPYSTHSEKATQAREAQQNKGNPRAQQKKEETQSVRRGDQIIKSKSEAALERQKGGCNVPVKHASSWETTFEDDDNSSA